MRGPLHCHICTGARLQIWCQNCKVNSECYWLANNAIQYNGLSTDIMVCVCVCIAIIVLTNVATIAHDNCSVQAWDKFEQELNSSTQLLQRSSWPVATVIARVEPQRPSYKMIFSYFPFFTHVPVFEEWWRTWARLQNSFDIEQNWNIPGKKWTLLKMDGEGWKYMGKTGK